MPYICDRAVIDMGQGSYVITLPIGWCRYFGIYPGQKLEVIANDDLIVRIKKQAEGPDKQSHKRASEECRNDPVY